MTKLTYKETEYSILVDVMAITLFCDELGIEIDKLGGDVFKKTINIYKLFKHSIKRGLRYDEKDNNLKEVDYENIFSANFNEICRIILAGEYLPAPSSSVLSELKAEIKQAKKKSVK